MGLLIVCDTAHIDHFILMIDSDRVKEESNKSHLTATGSKSRSHDVYYLFPKPSNYINCVNMEMI